MSAIRWFFLGAVMLLASPTLVAQESALKQLASEPNQQGVKDLVQSGKVSTGETGDLVASGSSLSSGERAFVDAINRLRQQALSEKERSRPGVTKAYVKRWQENEARLKPPPDESARIDSSKSMGGSNRDEGAAGQNSPAQASDLDAITFASPSLVETLLIQKGRVVEILTEVHIEPSKASLEEVLATSLAELLSRKIDSSRWVRIWNSADGGGSPPKGYDVSSARSQLAAGFLQSTMNLSEGVEKENCAMVVIGDSESWVVLWNKEKRFVESFSLGMGLRAVTQMLETEMGASGQARALTPSPQGEAGGRSSLSTAIEAAIAPRLPGPARLTAWEIKLIMCGGPLCSFVLSETKAAKPAAAALNSLLVGMAHDATRRSTRLYSWKQLAAGTLLLRAVCRQCGWIGSPVPGQLGAPLFPQRFCIPLGVGLPQLYNMPSKVGQ